MYSCCSLISHKVAYAESQMIVQLDCGFVLCIHNACSVHDRTVCQRVRKLTSCQTLYIEIPSNLGKYAKCRVLANKEKKNSTYMFRFSETSRDVLPKYVIGIYMMIYHHCDNCGAC